MSSLILAVSLENFASVAFLSFLPITLYYFVGFLEGLIISEIVGNSH